MTSLEKLSPIIHLTKNTRLALGTNDIFTKAELVFIFGDKAIVTWLKLFGYLRQTSYGWRKTDKLDELLAEGIEQIKTT